MARIGEKAPLARKRLIQSLQHAVERGGEPGHLIIRSLSVQYSAVVFGLGGALLALVFFAIRRMLRNQTMTQYVITGEPVFVDGVLVGRVPVLQENDLRTLESLFNEHVLEELARAFVVLKGCRNRIGEVVVVSVASMAHQLAVNGEELIRHILINTFSVALERDGVDR